MVVPARGTPFPGYLQSNMVMGGGWRTHGGLVLTGMVRTNSFSGCTVAYNGAPYRKAVASTLITRGVKSGLLSMTKGGSLSAVIWAVSGTPIGAVAAHRLGVHLDVYLMPNPTTSCAGGTTPDARTRLLSDGNVPSVPLQVELTGGKMMPCPISPLRGNDGDTSGSADR